MWILDYVTKNAEVKKDAACGNVTSTKSGTVTVSQSQDYLKLPVVAPYGIAYIPPVGENSVVLPVQGGEMCIGVKAPDKGLKPGEIMLFSSGGSNIHLKNDGTVSINGQTFGG